MTQSQTFSGSLKLRGLTAAVAIALLSPLAVSPAFADDASGTINKYSQIGGGDGPSNTVNGTGDTVWGENNTVSNKSTAFGSNNKASGQYATAFGYKTTATANEATAFGTETKAGSITGTPKGACYLNGNTEPTAGINEIGCSALAALGATWDADYDWKDGIGVSGKGLNATAWGKETVAGNDQATAFGSGNRAYGENSSILGGEGNAIGKFDADGNLTDEDGYGKNAAILGGSGNKVMGENAVAWGEGSKAWAKNSTAFGAESKAEGVNSLAALGGVVDSQSRNSIAIGLGAMATNGNRNNNVSAGDGAIAIGNNSKANGPRTISIGGDTDYAGAYAHNKGSIAIGGQAEAIGATVQLDGNGNIIKNAANKDLTHETGYYNRTPTSTDINVKTASQITVIGDRAAGYGDQSIAIGADTVAAGQSSIAIGGDDVGKQQEKALYKNTQTKLSALKTDVESAGYDVSGTLTRTTSIDQSFKDQTFASGDVSIAFGQKAVSQGDLSNAFGLGARSMGDKSESFGTMSYAGAENSTAVGTVAMTGNAAKDSTAIGYMAQTGGEVDLAATIKEVEYNDDGTLQGITDTGELAYQQTYSVNGGAEQKVKDLGKKSGSGINAVAVGERNKVLGDNSTAVGQGNIIIGNNSGAFGDPTIITGNYSYSHGHDNVIATDKTFVLGGKVTKTATNSVFLGEDTAYVKAEDDLTAANAGSTAALKEYETNAKDIKVLEFDADGNAVLVDDGKGGKTQKTSDTVAIKAGNLKFAGANAVGVVSVGDVGKERRIQNVAAGLIDENSTDAINGSQLYSVVQNLKSSAPETTEIKAEEGVAILPEPYTYQDKDGNPLTQVITYQDANGNPYQGAVSQDDNGNYIDADGKPLTQQITYNNADGSTYDSINNPVTTIDNGNKFVTASDVRDTINNVYWTVDATGNGNNSAVAQNVKAGNKVELIGGDGVSINQTNVSENETKFAFNVNVDNQTTRIKYVNTSGNEVAQDSSSGKWYPVGEDGNPNTSAPEVQAGDVTSQVVAKTTPLTMEEVADSTSGSTTPTGKVNVPSESGLATATDVANAINNSGWKVSGNNSDTAATGTANGTAELINPGDSVELIAGKGLKLDQTTQDGKTTFTFANAWTVTQDNGGTTINDGTNDYVIGKNTDNKTKLTSEKTKAPTAGDGGEYGSYTEGNIQLALKHAGDNDTGTDTFDVKLNNNVTLGDDTEAGSLNVSDKKDGDKKVANTEIKPNEINFTGGKDKENTGKITGLENHLADGSTDDSGNPITSNPNSGDLSSVQNQAATVGDVLNAGWDLQANGEAVDFITHGDTVNFASSDNSVSISGNLKNGVSTIDLTVATSKIEAGDDGKAKLGDVITYQDADGNTLIKDDGGNYTYADGSPYTGGVNNVQETTTPVDGNKVVTANDVVNAINNSGWKVSGNNSDDAATGTANGTAELINPGDNVAFVAGKGLKLDQTTADGTTTFTFSADVKDTNTVTTVTNGDNNVKVENIGSDDAPNYAVSLKKDVTLGDAGDNNSGSLTVAGDEGNTEIKPNNINFTNTDGGSITNLANHINGDDGSLYDDAAPTNQAATVQDVLNSGWNLNVGNASTNEYIKHNETVKFIDGKGTQVTGNKDGIAYNIKVDNNSPLSINGDNALTVNVGGFNRTNDGSVSANNSDGLVKAGDIATAVNNSGWVLTTSASGGTVSGTSRELIRPSNTMTLDAGDNIAIIQSGSKVRIATTRNINVAGDLNVAGNTNVHNLNVAPNSNVDMGGNQIHNVAPGTADTDAVNVSQLREATGTGPSVKQDIQNMGDQVRRESNAGTAQAMAVAGLPQAYLPGKNMVALGGSVYRGESGYAVGFSTISDNGSWIFKATGSGNSRGHYGGTVSGGFQW